jgi:D-alanyl-D-alanine carboxypeptidase
MVTSVRPRPGPRRFAAVLLAGAIAAAVAAPGAPASATPATTATDRLDASLEAVTAAGAIGVVGHSSGASGPSWTGAAGQRTIDGGQPVRPGDRARVASVTKAMVATVAMQEVDRGTWTLQTTVGDVVPGLLPGREDITLEQLLSHRSGLPDYVGPALGAQITTVETLVDALKRTRTDDELVRAALTTPMLFEPGTGFGYSNTNYVVTGMMLEKATGRSMASLLAQRVFRPAGMRTARFDDTARGFIGRDHVTDYATYERPYNFDSTNLTLLSSAGAVVANAPDIAAFYRALLGGRLVSKSALAQMLRPRTATPLAYGLGIYQAPDPCPAPDGTAQVLYGHDGASFGTITQVYTSADGTRQASVSFGGRQWLAEEPPTSVAANQFLVDAFTSTCDTRVSDAGRQRSLSGLEKLSRNLDGQLTARLTRVR